MRSVDTYKYIRVGDTYELHINTSWKNWIKSSDCVELRCQKKKTILHWTLISNEYFQCFNIPYLRLHRSKTLNEQRLQCRIHNLRLSAIGREHLKEKVKPGISFDLLIFIYPWYAAWFTSKISANGRDQHMKFTENTPLWKYILFAAVIVETSMCGK